MEQQQQQGWALITGASSGIGRAYAAEMASRGYNIVIVSNEREAIQQVGAELRQQYGVEVYARSQDLAIPHAAEILFQDCQEKQLVIDVLINNAGMFYFQEIVEEPVRTEKMLYLHIVTPTQLCYLFGREMKKRRHGYILNMSSMSAWIPYPGIGVYASSKRYLKNFSRALRSELLDYHVSVTAICPGAVATNLYNLKDSLKLLAIRLGVMMRPETLARKGVNAMFRRRSWVLPGLVNKIWVPLLLLLPPGLVRWLMRHTGLLPVTE